MKTEMLWFLDSYEHKEGLFGRKDECVFSMKQEDLIAFKNKIKDI